MEFASLEANSVRIIGRSYSFLSPFAGRSHNKTEILVTRTLSLNSIDQSNKQVFEA